MLIPRSHLCLAWIQEDNQLTEVGSLTGFKCKVIDETNRYLPQLIRVL